MLGFLGDIHGEMDVLQRVHDEVVKYPDIKALIQVGDFGFYSQYRVLFEKLQLTVPTYVIDGNHEDFDFLAKLIEQKGVNEDGTVTIGNNLFYVPRGTVLTLDNRTIAFCGGAASVDKKTRLQYGMPWHEGENITDADVMTAFAKTAGKKVDIFVTHCPPQSTIQRHFDNNDLWKYFRLPPTWRDPSADKIEELWTQMGRPTLICGHMHRVVVDGSVRILNIGELYCL